MLHSYHYHTTAAVVAEALVARGIDKKEATRIAVLVARSNAMVDYATPKNYPISMADKIGMVPVITQAYPKWSARVILGGGTWPVMERCHRWHHDPANGWPVVRREFDIEDLRFHDLDSDNLRAALTRCTMGVGAHLHTAQDTDGPHRDYVGYPSSLNYERTQALGKLNWYEKILPKRAVWSHMLDKEADNIERCREGAYISALRLYELVSGKQGDICGKEAISVLVVLKATNDKGLAGLSSGIFRELTAEFLPPFAPFEGEQLKQWFQVVR
jgi:hypothetical protein